MQGDGHHTVGAVDQQRLHECSIRNGPGARRRYRSPMGFNPIRANRKRGSDVFFVAAAVIVVLALVIWALLG